MDNYSNKSKSNNSRITQKSSYSSLNSITHQTPHKKKKTDRMIYSIDKNQFEWSNNKSRKKSQPKERAYHASSQNKFQDYLSDNLSQDSESFNQFLGKSLKRTKQFSYQKRHISQTPFKHADIMKWKDNFYSNLLDWNHQNMIFAATDHQIELFTIDTFDSHDPKVFIWPWIQGGKINSIKCSPIHKQTAVAYDNGALQIYDYQKRKALFLNNIHNGRITALDWNQKSILTGSKDKTIEMIDERTFKPSLDLYQPHKQEVLGVKRSNNLIASGGNDNLVAIYDVRKPETLLDYYEHYAAVKSLAWAESDRLLLSGGGTSDKMIKFWDHHEMNVLKEIQTGSQVCNLIISKNTKQFVSCQGFSQNQIVLWDYEGKKLQILHGQHSARVLYSALSPSGQYLATGAGDRNLLIWKMFPIPERKNRLLQNVDLR